MKELLTVLGCLLIPAAVLIPPIRRGEGRLSNRLKACPVRVGGVCRFGSGLRGAADGAGGLSRPASIKTKPLPRTTPTVFSRPDMTGTAVLPAASHCLGSGRMRCIPI